MRGTKTKPLYDVFLSHNSSDKPQVEMLATWLEDKAGLKPFLDRWHLIPGQPWQEELEKALNQSATCAVFLGVSGLGSWENEEMRLMLSRRVHDNQIRVIPVLLPGANLKDETTLPAFLQRYTWVDFRTGLDDQEAFRRLVAGIQGAIPGRNPLVPTQLPSSSISARQWLKGLFSATVVTAKPWIEPWKVVFGGVVALLLSTSFITAAIPRYKLQIKSPAFKKEQIYEAPTGSIYIKWTLLKEQWFQEIDVSNANANVAVKNTGDDKDQQFSSLPGELKITLQPGKYEVRIEVPEYQRTETIALHVTAKTAEDNQPIAEQNKSVNDKSGNGVAFIQSKNHKPNSGSAKPHSSVAASSKQNTVNPVRSMISGTVQDESGKAVSGAVISADGNSVVTNTAGYFKLFTMTPKGEAIHVRVLKEGFLPRNTSPLAGSTDIKIVLRTQ